MSSRSKRDRDRSPSDSERKHKKRHSLALPYNAAEIEEHDFFLKSSPFRVWLLEEKGKSFDSVSGEKAREYFDKFVRRWNKDKLDDKYYNPSIEAPTTTTHSWGIKRSEKESFEAERIKHSVATSNRIVQGPSRPPPEQGSRPSSLAELQARRAEEEEAREAEHKYKSAVKKKDRREEREEVNSNRATGKDRLQEKRMEARGSHAAFANRKEENMGLELDESTLGLKDGGDSFQAAIAARDRSQQVRGGRKAAQQEEKQAEMQDKRTEYRKKENDIMDQFKAMAAARFGA